MSIALKLWSLILLLPTCCWQQSFFYTSSLVATAQPTLRDLIVEHDEISLFRDIVNALGMLEGEFDSDAPDVNLTVFAPTNDAINADPNLVMYMTNMTNTAAGLPAWHLNLLAVINNHIVPNASLTKADIFNGRNLALITRQENVTVSQFLDVVGGAAITEPDLVASNGILQIINGVMEPSFMSSSLADLERTPEFGPDTLVPPRVSLQTIVDFVGARGELASVHPEGRTFAGCRIRALNRIGLDYLPQSINGAVDVKFGEFMNATFKNETFDELIRYSLLPRMYYRDDLPNNYEELTFGINPCAHMWVTKKDDVLCFNDGCQIATPDPVSTMASNGIAYVVDKCIVCPGIALLVQYASKYTSYNMVDSAQFWIATEWNLRNLSRSVGDGGPVTMFASDVDGWNVFNQDDTTRLATDKWKPHLLDLMSHNLVQGIYLEQDLRNLYAQNKGAYNLTTLAGQNITVDLDKNRDMLTVSAGDVVRSDIKGVDGYVHFTTSLSLPVSATHSVYDIATLINNFTTQVALIDGVFLREDMRRLSPMTALYATNTGWENKVIDLNKISKTVLENMMFENLLWCGTLRNMTGQSIDSLNGESWFITVNEANMPCFDTVQTFGGSPNRVCITRCDILAKNGLVHELDNVMLYEQLATTGPQAPITPTVNAPSAQAYNPPTIVASSDSNTSSANGAFGADGSYTGSFGAPAASAVQQQDSQPSSYGTSNPVWTILSSCLILLVGLMVN